jgi:UDP-glucose 4-epimerase
MKVAVTGGSGQLGTKVLRRLAADPSIREVISLDLRPPIVAAEKIRAVKADVRDPDFARHLDGCHALVHLAFIVTQWTPADRFRAINVDGSINVFRAAAAAGVETIVYTSSVAAYGVTPDHPVPIVEDTPRRRHVELPYAAHKFDVEAFLDAFEPDHPGIAVSRLRPAILAGVRMEHELGRALALGVMPDAGAPTMPFVWDEDVADAAVICLKKRTRGAFNVVAEGAPTAAELAAASGLRRLRVPRTILRGVARLSPLLARFGIAGADPSWADIELPTLVYSSEKAKRELGWTPRYPTAEDVIRHAAETARGLTDPRVALSLRLAGVAAEREPPRADTASVTATVHLEITGPGGGDWAIRVDGGRVRIAPGLPRPPTSVVSLATSTFVDLLSGEVSPKATWSTGKVRIEGDPIGATILTDLVARLHGEAQRPGARGWPARRITRWIGARA